jgi:hypothetical protein
LIFNYLEELDNSVMNQVITDQLSSTVAVTDVSGSLLEETRYMPFTCPGLLGGLALS